VGLILSATGGGDSDGIGLESGCGGGMVLSGALGLVLTCMVNGSNTAWVLHIGGISGGEDEDVVAEWDADNVSSAGICGGCGDR
jgi:hypothetical protein